MIGSFNRQPTNSFEFYFKNVKARQLRNNLWDHKRLNVRHIVKLAEIVPVISILNLNENK